MFRVGIGEYAALGTALSWGVSTQVHSAVSRMIGPEALVLLRVPYQLLFLVILCALFAGPAPMSLGTLLLIFLSAFFGLALTDLCLYRGIMYVGPQIGVLLQSVSAIFAALLGFIFLHETLSLQAMAGIAVVSMGVGVVLTERNGSTMLPGQQFPQGKTLVLGVCLGLGSAFFLACSFIIIKSVMYSGLSPLWVSVVRTAFGTVFLWGLGLFRGWSRAAVQGVCAKPRILWILLGSNLFSAVGMWCSNVALNNAPSGIAASIMGLQPIMVTIIGAIWYHKRPSLRIVSGTLMAFGGTVLLCLR